MSAITSYFSPRVDTSSEEKAVQLGAAARRMYEDWKNADIDAFALRLAAEKQAKATSASANIKVAGRGGRATASKGGGKKGRSSGDLAVEPINPNIVPRSFPSTMNVKVPKRFRYTTATITTSTSVVTESNYVFALNNFPNYTNYTNEYDQYVIWSVEASIEWSVPPGGTAATGQVHSAIDFDNTAALGTIQLLEDYATHKVQNLKPGSVTRRMCKPCVSTSTGSASLGGVARQWIDSAYPAVSHYGLRFIISATGQALTGTVILTGNVWFSRGI